MEKEQTTEASGESIHICHPKVGKGWLPIQHLSTGDTQKVCRKKVVVFHFSSAFDVSQKVIEAIVLCSHCVTYPAASSLSSWAFFQLIGPCLAC